MEHGSVVWWLVGGAERYIRNSEESRRFGGSEIWPCEWCVAWGRLTVTDSHAQCWPIIMESVASRSSAERLFWSTKIKVYCV